MKISDILENKVDKGLAPDDNEILAMLSVDNTGEDFYRIIAASNRYTRTKLKGKGYVFVQIGLNAEPCSGNCLFCSMGAAHFSVDRKWRKSLDEIKEEINRTDQNKIDDIFLMTTADYPMKEFLKTAAEVKSMLAPGIRLVANIRDFDKEEAEAMKEAGITGVYHVNRLREGIDTDLRPEDRIRTLEIIKETGLELYYCIEPIGAEHSYEEILVEIKRAMQLKPEVMAVMRRVNYPNSPMSDRSMISALELTKIAAVANLAIRPSRAMNLHESEQMSLLAGVNQLYAEIGANPRDTCHHTEESRGISVDKARKMLEEAGYTL